MDANASRPVPSPDSETGVLLSHLSASNLALTLAAVVLVLPKLLSRIRNAVSPLRSIPGPLINKMSSWLLTIATLRGTKCVARARPPMCSA